MYLGLLLTVAGLAPATPLPEPADDDPTTVVLRLNCPSAADAAVCKSLFGEPRVLGSAMSGRWVTGFPVLKRFGWLRRHLHVKISGGETIRVWVSGSLPRRDRAALANAVVAAWLSAFWSAGVRQTFADIAPERRAQETKAALLRAAGRKLMQAQGDVAAARGRADEKKAMYALDRAAREEAEATAEWQPASLRFAQAQGRAPFTIVRLADGPRDAALEQHVGPRRRRVSEP